MKKETRLGITPPDTHKKRRPVRLLAWLLAFLLVWMPAAEAARYVKLLGPKPRYDLTDEGHYWISKHFENELGPGVFLTRFERKQKKGSGRVRGAILEVDLVSPNVSLDYLYSGTVTQKRTVTQLMQRAPGVAAAVNGDFFDFRSTNLPKGNSQDDTGEVLNAWSYPYRTSLLIDQAGRAHIGASKLVGTVTIGGEDFMINGVNTPAAADGSFAVYTDKWGRYRKLLDRDEGLEAVLDANLQVIKVQPLSKEAVPQGHLVLAAPGGASLEALKRLQGGETLSIQYNLDSDIGQPQLAMVGGHHLLEKGRIVIEDKEYHPRTAAGVNAAGTKLFLLTIEGRSRASDGMSMVQLARLLRQLGASDAVNFDGGGSTTMAVKPAGYDKARVVNRLSDGSQRYVANALGIRLKRLTKDPDFFQNVTVGRIGGENRIDTAVQLATRYYKKADTVVLARQDVFADALAAGPLAAALKAPILLVPAQSLPPQVAETIQSLGASRVVLAGGPSALSPDLEEALTGLGIQKLDRLGGESRYETAALLAQAVISATGNKEVLVATGEGFADALAATPLATKNHQAIFLVGQGPTPAMVKEVMKRLGVKRMRIIGGPQAVPEAALKGLPPVRDRLFGADRYETALALARAMGYQREAFVASGDAFADAMVAGPIAGHLGKPILLTGAKVLSPALRRFIDRSELYDFTVIGGKAAILSHVVASLQALDY